MIKKRIKRINNADNNADKLTMLIIFTKGADIFGHDCVCMSVCMCIYIYIYLFITGSSLFLLYNLDKLKLQSVTFLI